MAPTTLALTVATFSALLVSACSLGSSSSAGEASDAGARWLRPFVDQARSGGWDLIAADPSSPTRYVDFARPQDVLARDGYLETAIREERSDPAVLDLAEGPFRFLSTSGRWVVDCGGNRFTSVSQSWYRGNGLTGESHTETDPSLRNWTAITPNSLGAIVEKWVCARAPRP